jgi:hypothetical protein
LSSNDHADTLVTYVIEYPGTNLIKIGQAKYFVDRFAQLKTGSPVDPVVLCVFRGAKHERDFHKRFDHLRHHGEFYHFTPEIKAYVFSDELAEHRITREEAEKLSPRIERKAERARREKRLSELDQIKAEEMEPPLETNE